MRWEEQEDALEVLETEREYDGYFCSIKAAVIIVILGSLCDLQSVKNILSRNVRNQTDTVLLVAVKSACNHTSGIIE